MKSFMANPSNIERKWFVVDATDKTLGRLAAEVAKVLRGKHKPTFTPHMDTGDNVIMTQKTYFHHTGYLGGDRFVLAKDMLANNPVRMVEIAVRGMIPKNRLGDQIYKKLHVYAGPEHPHAAQQPEVLEINVR